MSDYMIMPQPIRLPLLHFFFFFFFFFAKAEGNSFTTSSIFHQILPLVTSSFFQNWKSSSLDGDIGLDRRLDLPYTSTLPVYLNQRTVTHSGSGFIKWKYAFLVMGTTLRAWNKEIYILNVPYQNKQFFSTHLVKSIEDWQQNVVSCYSIRLVSKI